MTDNSIKRSGNNNNDYKQNIPEIRFPEFDGEWNETKLGQISRIHDGTHGTHQNVEKGKYLLSAENIENGKVIIKEEPRIISEEDFNKIHKKYFIENGDLLLTIVGSIGRTAIVENYNKEYTFQRSVAIINSEINSYFLNYYIQSPKVQKELKIRTNSSAQGGIYLKELSKIKINCPSDNEQQKIARLFLALDQKIEFMEKKYKTYKKMKNTFLYNMFCNKQNIPELRFPEFTDEWAEERFNNHLNIISGKGFKAAEYVEKGVPLIKIDNIGYGNIKWEHKDFLPNEYLDKFENLSLKENDLLLALNRPITNNQLKFTQLKKMDVPSILYQRVGKIIFKDEYLSKNFTYYLLRKYIFQFVIKTSVGSDQPFISTNELKKMKIKYPNYDEQEKIANFLITIDRKIELMEKKIEFTINFRQSLLSKMFC